MAVSLCRNSDEIAELICTRPGRGTDLYVLHIYNMSSGVHSRAVFHGQHEAWEGWENLIRGVADIHIEPTNAVAGIVATEADLFEARKVYLHSEGGEDAPLTIRRKLRDLGSTLLYPKFGDMAEQVIGVQTKKGALSSLSHVVGSLRMALPLPNREKLELRVAYEFEANVKEEPAHVRGSAISGVTEMFRNIIRTRRVGLAIRSGGAVIGQRVLFVSLPLLDTPRLYSTKALIDFCPRIPTVFTGEGTEVDTTAVVVEEDNG